MLRATLLLLGLAIACYSQPLTRQTLPAALDFEKSLTGWSSMPGVAEIDATVFHGGKQSVRIARKADSRGSFSTITINLPIDFDGKNIELRGYLKTENLADYAALWMRVDGDGSPLAFASLQQQKIDGTRDRKEYSIQVALPPEGKRLFFGFLLAGTGTAWADDLQLLIDGKPAATVPVRPPVETPITRDHTFDGSSRFQRIDLSPVQVSHLVTLGRVWGFLKYHHPAITGGKRHWDYDLFRVLPAVADAPDRAAANAVILSWVQGLGEVPACVSCASLPKQNLHLRPELDWLSDTQLLGAELSAALTHIHRNRLPLRQQFYLGQVPGVGNPRFENEPGYPQFEMPDSGYQLLALFRAWNIFQYFYPARDTMPDRPGEAQAYWLSVLEEYIPRVALAKSPAMYKQQMIRFIARVNDTHANLANALAVRPPAGPCQLPVVIRFIDGQPVVYRQFTPEAALRPGDVLTHLDGVTVGELVTQRKPFYAASNEPTRLHNIGLFFTRGECGAARLQIVREGKAMAIEDSRQEISIPEAMRQSMRHDRPGPTFQKLSDDVAYLKLSDVKAANAAQYVRDAAGTKGLIIDIRNYPSEFMVFALGSLLHREKTPFARFTNIDPANPGATIWTEPIPIEPTEPHYAGKVAILVDEASISQSEYTAMAFRAVPGAKVIGSTTAGADGNVSPFAMPGGLQSMVSGLGVFYPDKSPTQRIGIQPDIVVRPTVQGFREGRDEVLEAAIRFVTGGGK